MTKQVIINESEIKILEDIRLDLNKLISVNPDFSINDLIILNITSKIWTITHRKRLRISENKSWLSNLIKI